MKLYVTYSFQAGENRMGHGRIVLDDPSDIRDFETIKAIEKFICETNPDFTNVFLMSWTKLEA